MINWLHISVIVDALHEPVRVCMKNTPYPATDTRHLQTASDPHPRVFFSTSAPCREGSNFYPKKYVINGTFKKQTIS